MAKKGNRGNPVSSPRMINSVNTSPSNDKPNSADSVNTSPSNDKPENANQQCKEIYDSAQMTQAVVSSESTIKSPFLRFINKYSNVILVVLAFLMPFITNPVNRLVDKLLEKPVDKTAIVKDQIKQDVDMIREMLGNSNKTADSLTIKGNSVNSFQSSIRDLVRYHGVHDISDFDGENLNESCLMAKTNLLERGIYDNDLKKVLFNLDSIYEIDVIKENKFMYLAKQNVSSMATRWLMEDSTRNCKVSANLERASNSNDSIGFINALNPLIDYKKNLFNYRFQKSFYDHLIRVNRQL